MNLNVYTILGKHKPCHLGMGMLSWNAAFFSALLQCGSSGELLSELQNYILVLPSQWILLALSKINHFPLFLELHCPTLAPNSLRGIDLRQSAYIMDPALGVW